MLAKAICVAVSGLSLAITVTPPPSSRTVSESKDKIKVEGHYVDSKSSPYIFVGMTLFETMVYLLLMYLGHNQHNHGVAAVKRLGVLEPWHGIFTIIALGGMLLRRWSFMKLDHFFTYQLTIRPGHVLVKDGPYRFLIHPSYTGAFINTFFVYMVIWYRGLWDVAVWYLGRFTIRHQQQQQPSELMGLLIPTFYGVFVAFMFLRRHKKEEKMLHEHFGDEWTEYVSRRWRFIPFLY